MAREPLYQWMVKYTPQSEWVGEKGVMFCLAFFFIQLGAGMFLISSILNFFLGTFIGWLICVFLGGGVHLLHLGHPVRFYRMVLRPQTSWISRGLLFVFGFLILGGLQIILSLFGIPSLVLLILANALAFLTLIYGGFALSCINGIPFWNSALLPLLFAVSGCWGGAGLTTVLLLNIGGAGTLFAVAEVGRVLLLGFIVILPTYLIAARYGLPSGKASVSEMVAGRLWPLFWIGVVLLGLGLPLGVVIYSLVIGLEKTPFMLLYLSIIFELLGDLFLRYLILNSGFYNPLISPPDYVSNSSPG